MYIRICTIHLFWGDNGCLAIIILAGTIAPRRPVCFSTTGAQVQSQTPQPNSNIPKVCSCVSFQKRFDNDVERECQRTLVPQSTWIAGEKRWENKLQHFLLWGLESEPLLCWTGGTENCGERATFIMGFQEKLFRCLSSRSSSLSFCLVFWWLSNLNHCRWIPGCCRDGCFWATSQVSNNNNNNGIVNGSKAEAPECQKR